MESEPNNSRPESYRIRRVSFVDTGVLFSIFLVAVYLLLGMVGYVRTNHLALDSLKAVVGGFVAGNLFALTFNVYCTIAGGLRVQVSAEPATVKATNNPTPKPNVSPDPLAASAGTSETKHCPECKAIVRADRTFCPDCDHDFE